MEENINEKVNILCPVCGTNHRLFVESDNHGEAKMCFNCGFMTHSRYISNSEFSSNIEKQNPKIVNALKIEHEGLNWYPSVINIPNKGIIYPEGTSIEDWKWTLARVIDIPIFERIKYPVPGKEGEFYETMLDIENSIKYERLQFTEACKELGIIKDI
mgnify:FL=1